VLRLIDLDPSIWGAAAVAVLMVAWTIWSRRNFRAIPEILPIPKASASHPLDCMVVIPARNEEAVIGRTVRSLPPDSVIVVDDFSDDATAAQAEKAGAGVLHAPELLPGALGKSNACLEGARVLTSRWILFTDADTWFEPGFLESIVSAAESSNTDFLSLYLQPAYETLSASILGPLFVALYFCGANPRSDPAATFCGQCVLVRRSAYEFVGGHKALLNYLNEDVKMAALAQRHRLAFAVARAGPLGKGSIDPRDFERNAHRFTIVSLWIGTRIMLAGLTFALWIPALAWLLVKQHWIAAAVFALVPVALLAPWYGFPRAFLVPFAILRMVPLLLRCMVGALASRHVEWKGRVI
jgi:glycosyltransferase involved in cell wall biosynthesis